MIHREFRGEVYVREQAAHRPAPRLKSSPKRHTIRGVTTENPVDVPSDIFRRVQERIAAPFTLINGADSATLAADLLNGIKSRRRAEVFQRYVPLRGKKLLEVGSGCGVNLVVWSREFGVDAFGIEPGLAGFESSFEISQELLPVNGIDKARVRDAVGEALPFPDESFDLVYSANVLEHTNEPARVLAESFRVLRTGGTLQFEIPNFLSYYEGHYLIPIPPLLWRGLLPFWVKYVFRRNPAFARTLHTEINPVWCRRTLRGLGGNFELEALSFGEDVFLDRLAAPFEFETPQMQSRLAGTVRLIQRLNVKNWMGRMIVAAQGYFPIYLTVRKRGNERRKS